MTGIRRSGDKLLGARENDRRGVGFFHYGVTDPPARRTGRAWRQRTKF